VNGILDFGRDGLVDGYGASMTLDGALLLMFLVKAIQAFTVLSLTVAITHEYLFSLSLLHLQTAALSFPHFMFSHLAFANVSEVSVSAEVLRRMLGDGVSEWASHGVALRLRLWWWRLGVVLMALPMTGRTLGEVRDREAVIS
jgi:hypothetical protein